MINGLRVSSLELGEMMGGGVIRSIVKCSKLNVSMKKSEKFFLVCLLISYLPSYSSSSRPFQPDLPLALSSPQHSLFECLHHQVEIMLNTF